MGSTYKENVKTLYWKKRLQISESEESGFIKKLLDDGYIIKDENSHQYILYAPKRFNWFALIGLTLVFNVFGLFGYLIYYFTKKHGKEVSVIKSERKSKTDK